MQDFESCLIRSWIANVESPPIEFTPTSRKIGPILHQVVSNIQVSREVLLFIFPFRFVSCHYPRVHKNPTKKNHCPRSILAFAILFQIHFVEFVSVVESCCWFSEFVVVVQSPVAVCLFPPLSHSTVTQTTSRSNPLLDLPSLAALRELSPR